MSVRLIVITDADGHEGSLACEKKTSSWGNFRHKTESTERKSFIEEYCLGVIPDQVAEVCGEVGARHRLQADDLAVGVGGQLGRVHDAVLLKV